MGVSGPESAGISLCPVPQSQLALVASCGGGPIRLWVYSGDVWCKTVSILPELKYLANGEQVRLALDIGFMVEAEPADELIDFGALIVGPKHCFS